MSAPPAYWAFRNALSRQLTLPPVRNETIRISQYGQSIKGQVFIDCEIIVTGERVLIDSCAFVNSKIYFDSSGGIVSNCQFTQERGEFQCN